MRAQNTFRILSLVGVFGFLISACSTPDTDLKHESDSTVAADTLNSAHNYSVADSMSDEYEEQAIRIKNQIWMASNLNIDTFQNGDLILEAKTAEEWNRAASEKVAAWCYYDNDAQNGSAYGRMYNWYAVNDPRGIAPAGWHVPSDTEWNQLINNIGSLKAGSKLKSTQGWKQGCNGTNESSFSGLPGGYRTGETSMTSKDFSYAGTYSSWWASAKHDNSNAYCFTLSCEEACEIIDQYNGTWMGAGCYVRCIKNQ